MSSESDEAYDDDQLSEASDYSGDAKPKRKKVIKKQSAAPKKRGAPKGAKSKEAQQPKQAKKPEPKADKNAQFVKQIGRMLKGVDDLVHVEPMKPLNNEDYETLLKCEDAPLFSLNYQTHLAKVLSIYDGDTITAVFFIKGDLRKYKIRINGIDTAEMKDSDPQVSELAHHTVEAILPIKGKIVKAELGKFDKYGRVLSKISVATAEGDIDLTKWMIEKGIAKAYDGKTKNVFTKQDAARLKGVIENIKLPEVRNYHNPVVQESV